MEKKTYSAPVLEIIILDNEISLALQSTNLPPFGPGESEMNDEFYFEILSD